MRIAITRAVSPSINRCELTNLERVPIDVERANEQHSNYEAALESLGVEVHPLPAEPEMPDAVFVEDMAVVLDECAILTRPGAPSRRAEVESVALALAPYRQMFTIQAPGTMDGGDVLAVGKSIYIGQSSRSNGSAIEQVKSFLTPFGYRVQAVPVSGCLHLKSAVTQVNPKLLLINSNWVDKKVFQDVDFLEVDPFEPNAANALCVGETVIYSPAYPKTIQRLENAGIHPLLVDQSELAKAEGALTCCSLIFENRN